MTKEGIRRGRKIIGRDNRAIDPNKLRQLRTSFGLRQADVAKQIGVSTGLVSAWERGSQSNLSLEQRTALGQILGVDQ